MPYKMLDNKNNTFDTLGQSWKGDEIENNISLCDKQSINKYFQQYLQLDGKILEAGCGIGRWVFYLRKKGYDIIGLESSLNAIKIAKEYDNNIPIRFGNVLKTDFKDKYFDSIISLGVMEHFEDGPKRVLEETKRILKDDGYLFVTIPPSNLLRKIYTHRKASLTVFKKRLFGSEFVFSEYRYSVNEFKSHLVDAGFKIIKIATDELESPLNMGLYTDIPFFRSGESPWMLNKIGIIVERALNNISSKIYRGGVLYICKKTT